MKAIALNSGFADTVEYLHEIEHPYWISENAVWAAFRSGMEVFFRYANRSEADSYEIARSNLRLLHRTLLNDPIYREILKAVKASLADHGVTSTLFSTPDLSVKLTSIKKNCESKFFSDQCNLNMALVISGNATINHPGSSLVNENSVWKPYSWIYWGSNIDNQYYKKEGDIILFNTWDRETDIVFANKKDCILLQVQLSAQDSTPI